MQWLAWGDHSSPAPPSTDWHFKSLLPFSSGGLLQCCNKCSAFNVWLLQWQHIIGSPLQFPLQRSILPAACNPLLQLITISSHSYSYYSLQHIMSATTMPLSNAAADLAAATDLDTAADLDATADLDAAADLAADACCQWLALQNTPSHCTLCHCSLSCCCPPTHPAQG